MNKATKCQAQGSRGFHIWMYLSTTIEGNRKETCSNPGCACAREVDAFRKPIPGSFQAS